MRPGSLLAGRYEFVRELGVGGAGELLLVKDREQELEPCALKILRPRVPDPGLAPLFRNEFLLLADVRHEHIVGVRNFGEMEEGEAFFTMDFVPGENGRSFVREDRLESGDYLDLAAGLLSALAHVHARGILHRDIKPENIIMRRGDGRLHPVLVDFGLAITAGAEPAGEATGTLPYIAPEVLAGAGAGPRSDLFSLGMVLYEVATGRSVAESRDLLRSPRRALAPDRVRRNLRRSGRGTVPRRYEDFVSKLLAPTPAGRHASAAAALRDLAEIFGEEFGLDAVELAARPALGEPPLVGRDGVLEDLLKWVDALRDSALLEPLMVVAGPEGIGVSRVLAALRNHAAVSGCVVASGSSLRELGRDLLARPNVRTNGVAVGDSPGQQIFRIDAVLHGLAQDEHPVLILDDVHRMGNAECSALREWIAALERREGRARLLLVIGGRNSGEGPGVELLKTAGGSVPVELRDLAPLKRGDIRSALATVLGQARIPSDVVQTLERATEGNPRVLAELLGLLVDHGVLDLSGEQPELRPELLKDVKLPDGVVDATRRRAEQLPADARALVARFAMIEEPLPFAAARALAGDHLETLRAARFLVRDRGRLRFASELARRGADVLQGAARKAALRETAQALADTAPAAAALLLAEAGDLEQAREFGVAAARRMRADGRLEEARRLLRGILGVDPDPATGSLLLQVLLDAGRYHEAADLGQHLADHGGSADVELMLQVASALRTAGRPDQSLRLLERIDGGADREVAARVINAKAAVLDSLARFEEAMFESRRAEAEAGSLLALGGRVARVRANLLRRMHQPAVARSVEDALIAAPADDVSDWARRTALLNRALLHRTQGCARAALRDARAARAHAGRTGALAAEGHALRVMAHVLGDLGRHRRSVRLFERARSVFERTASEEFVASTLAAEARGLALSGRPTEAEQRLTRLEHLPGIGRLPEEQRDARAVRALLSHLAGDTRAAARELEGQLEEPLAPEQARLPRARQRAEVVSALGDADAAEGSWRLVLRLAWEERCLAALPAARVGLAA
ncbi:MAG: protein kinase domain-containing protein, partial [Planctomycetota bacterium]